MPNEILQALPAKLKAAVRQLFVTMWLTGYMPDSSKTSRTVLLYKKGNPTILSNRRPIALANNLYKTWTSMVTHVPQLMDKSKESLAAQRRDSADTLIPAGNFKWPC